MTRKTERRSEAIWRESDQRWMVRVQKGGVRKCFYSTTPGRRGKHAAEDDADDWLERQSEDMRFPDAWELFMADQKSRTSKANWSKHEAAGRLYILPAIGNKYISTITPVMWQSCVDRAASAGLSQRSCQNVRASITSFLRYARRARWDVEQLIEGDVTIPRNAAPATDKSILQPDDIRKLFSEGETIRSGRLVTAHYVYAWRFLVVTGLRRGELVGLRNEDISNGIVTIRRAVNSYREETAGKNANALRSFFITPIMQQILDDQRQYLRDSGIISPWVFPDEHGDCAKPQSITDRWRFYCAQHGIAHTTIHGLRHTFVSIGKADLPLQLMKQTIGHSTSMDTYGIYGHDVDGEKKRAAEIMEDVFEQILRKG